jgi:uncharacterized protein YdiU (UPF0061 family)
MLLALHEGQFEHALVDALPGDPNGQNTVREVRQACYSYVLPTAVSSPRLIAWSHHLATRMGVLPPKRDTGWEADILSGNHVLPSMKPFATCYGGHQFGHWARQLGDGRAISLGEWRAPDDTRHEVQLKGAGPTPYSRHADGRAVLRSSIREFIASEAMHHLGVPTTRALALCLTGDRIERDMFYTGHPRLEPGAIVTRVAPTFLRFGHYQLPAARQDSDLLRRLIDFTIKRYYPHLDVNQPDAITCWFVEVAELTAKMVAHWMRVGFVHGVMNTDNMSIIGLTIDYGPFAWLDEFDPDFTPNTTDAAHGRYRYRSQPAIARWNLARLGDALLTFGVAADALEAGLEHYQRTYEREYRKQRLAKIGLFKAHDRFDLFDGLMPLLMDSRADWTLFFRHLASVALAESVDTNGWLQQMRPAFYSDLADPLIARWQTWFQALSVAVQEEGMAPGTRRDRMNRVNPAIIPRNYLLHEVIQAAEKNDFAPLERLCAAIETPYIENNVTKPLMGRIPEWARQTPGCSALSCSS